jgi:Zn-dependent M28 family amino/carboxypeptidase
VPVLAAQIATVEDLVGSVRQGLVGKTVRARVEFRTGITPTQNVIAETRGGDPNKVIVVGAHLDSVGTGPGINDNGSGSAAILEMAQALRGVYPKNKIRFIWFSAEESGLLGSEHYVASLPAEEQAKIAANLNFDMIGSPNFVNFVYDGDLSDSPPIGEDVFHPAARPFSATIEKIFLDYFKSQRIATAPTDFDGRSDYGPFIRNGIPAGGLFTGAEGLKTPAQAALFGGIAGEPFDPCYHQGCDTFFNNSNRALDQNSDAAAHALITLAQMKIPDRPPVASAPAARQRVTATHNQEYIDQIQPLEP